MSVRRCLQPTISFTRLFSSRINRIDVLSLESPNDCVDVEYTTHASEPFRVCVPVVWLRDHCRSTKCFNHTTNQRRSNAIDIFAEARISDSSSVSLDSSGNLSVEWLDGHRSSFGLSQLLEQGQPRVAPSTSSAHQAWDKDTLSQIPRMNANSLSYPDFCRDFVRYGVAIIDGVEPTAEATERLCRQIAPIHDTYYGAFWVFSNESNELPGEEYHEDTAYSNEEIGPHTDGTYFDQTPGIQVFHCLQPAAVGGDTVVVDGLRCAEILRDTDPKAFDVLCRTKVDHHYLEGGSEGSALNTICREKPIIELNSQGNVVQIRFNPYDRAPYRCLMPSPVASHTLQVTSSSARDALSFYRAYSLFSRICHDPSLAITVSLRPGDVIFIDNFRVFHARTHFQGYRQMSGCYLSRDNFMAKARPHLSEEIRKTI